MQISCNQTIAYRSTSALQQPHKHEKQNCVALAPVVWHMFCRSAGPASSTPLRRTVSLGLVVHVHYRHPYGECVVRGEITARLVLGYD